MDPARYERLAELFELACALDPAEREAFLATECDDETLRAEVLGLVAHDERPHPGLSESDAARAQLVREALSSQGDEQRAGATRPRRTPTRIGPYKLIEKIGEGGMGEVYVAQQLQPVERRVALKLIKRGMDSAAVVARFEAERQALARMSHPNVTPVLDGGTTDDGRSYFVMEYVAGETLTTYCDRRRLSTRMRLGLFLDVCRGVEHAHQKGLIHRDLKPNNLLVTEQDGGPVPKVIDFGVARATTGRLGQGSLHTMAGQVIGTPDYMSPEQADPTGIDIDTRSDVYSMGVVLYQLVSGLLPFVHKGSFSEIQRAIRETDPPRPSTRLRRSEQSANVIAPRHGTDSRALVRGLEGDLDWICLKALEKNPGQRYASVAEFADDVRRHLAHEPVLARRPSAVYRLRKFVRRHRVGVAVGLLVGASLVVAAAGLAEAASRGRQVLRLSDGTRLDALLAEADVLHPPYPVGGRLAAMTDWSERAAGLLTGLDDHRRIVSQLTSALEEDRSDGSARVEDEWQLATLAQLIERLEGLAVLLDDDTAITEHGWGMSKRLAFARELAASSSDGGSINAAWSEALPRIEEAYPGLDASPRMGLVPLGPDPVTALWEFAHLMTGESATRAPDGRLVLTTRTGVVLVLLPGGSFWMGAQPDDATARQYDPRAIGGEGGEGPVHEVRLSPFLISKYELTQAQWQRLTGRNPSMKQAGGDTARHPVEGVDWWVASNCMERAGLALPSEAQWEYAARAGTQAPWSTGEDPGALIGAANLGHDDGLRGGHAEVGILAPNAFGLHDVHGNVWEWCRDAAGDGEFYSRSPELDPVSVLDEDIGGASVGRAYRGGAFKNPPFSARSSHRMFRAPTWSGGSIGIRPAMPWAE